MKKLFLVAAVLFGMVVLLFYFTLRSSTWDKSQEIPYNTVVGKTIFLERPVSLLKNVESFVIKEAHFLSEDEDLYNEVIRVARLPKGTPITFTQAFHHLNRVSGNTTSLLVGEVFVADLQQTIRFEYRWGEEHIICIDEPCGYWTYPLAVWQTRADTSKYFLAE